MLILGGITLFINPIVGLIILIIGAFASFSTIGFEIDTEKIKAREYFNYLGLKLGDWEKLENFPDLAVLYSVQSSSAFSRAMIEMETSREKFYNVCLLNASHRKKLVVKKLKDRIEAERLANEIADLLGKRFTNFNPKISAKTQERKRRSRSRN